MSMTVRELRRALRQYPPDSLVGIQDHDAGQHELSAHVEGVDAFDPALCEVHSACGTAPIPCPEWAEGVYVVIRA